MEIKWKSIDPDSVPKKRLESGDEIPILGLGTFGSDHIRPEQIAQAVKHAIQSGYRHIDCASIYMNEQEIGGAINELLDEAIVNREELWITSKVWNDMHGDGQVVESCKRTLEDLQLDYLDLYLVHWPFPNHHDPGCDGDTRSSRSQPYIHANYMIAWRQMEQLVELGLVRNIGTSNMTVPKMKLLLRDAQIKPVINEMELHPHFQQEELFQFMTGNGIQPIGYSPIGSPRRPERDKTAQDTIDVEDPVILEIAENHKVHPAIVCIKWAVQRGQIPIPFSIDPKKVMANLECVIGDPLSKEEMDSISGIDKNCRLIKGQVFLWEGANSWEDLWDIDGEIIN